MRSTITATELRDRLTRAGHALPTPIDEAPGAADACPRPETIVTVGLDLDPTLRPAYRDRYFACLLESPENPVPVLQYDAAFALTEPFRNVAGKQPPAGDFMGGPFRWLLHRLLRFRHVLLWPSSRGTTLGNSGFDWLEPSERLPRLGAWLREAKPAALTVGAIMLDLSEASDFGVLWEVAADVSNSFKDYYASDQDCQEVYTLHHHDKVIASVPDRAAREAMLQELTDRDDVLEDCSGYVSVMDDEPEEQ